MYHLHFLLILIVPFNTEFDQETLFLLITKIFKTNKYMLLEGICK